MCLVQWGTTITNPTEGALTQLRSLCRLLRILDVCKMRHRFAEHFGERLFKSSYNQLLNSHDSEASYIAICGYSLTCPSMWKHNTYSRWNVDWWPDDRCAGSMPERMFTIIYSSPYASHETATSSHIVKYWYHITCPSIWKHDVYINVHLQSMTRRGTFDWIQCPDGVVLVVLSIDHTYGMLFCLLTTHTACCSVYWPHIRHAHI